MVVGGRGSCGDWKDRNTESRARSGRRKLRFTREEVVIGGEKRGGKLNLRR